jgi:hypothetical protein
MRKRRDYIKIAAEKLDMPPEALRIWLKDKDVPCPFGRAIKGEDNRRFTYYINMNRLEAYLRGSDLTKEAI